MRRPNGIDVDEVETGRARCIVADGDGSHARVAARGVGLFGWLP